jgi:BirA family biotin operon repressor/biotin-[acetyl-CoA-carboxylase] ligase
MDGHWDIYSFVTVTSTQDVAKNYMAEGRPLPFAILSDIQTAGRGRMGNLWVSPKGNLYSSLALDIGNFPAKDGGQYSFLTAVALMETLSDYGVTDAQNKWPNDILVKGKKIAGILLESDGVANGLLKTLVIGMGVNLQSAPEGAVAVNALVGQEIYPAEFLNGFIAQLQRHLDVLNSQGFSAIRTKWLEKAYGLGMEIRVRLPNETFYGEFIGLHENGALMVRIANEQEPRIIHSGDVFFEGRDINA